MGGSVRSIRKLKGTNVLDAARHALHVLCVNVKNLFEKRVSRIAVKRRSVASLRSSLAAELIKHSGVGRIIKLS